MLVLRFTMSMNSLFFEFNYIVNVIPKYTDIAFFGRIMNTGNI